MPRWFWFIAIPLLLIFFAVDAYFLYGYLTKPKILPSPTSVIGQTVNLQGEIKPGWQLPLNQGYCAKSYYLVSETGIIEVWLNENLTYNNITDFRRYSNVEVKMSGIQKNQNSVSCGNFVNVETIEVIQINLNNFEVNGTIACLPDDTDGCSKSLQIGDAFLFLENTTIDAYEVGDKVRVTGIVDKEFVSPQNYTGAIYVLGLTSLAERLILK